jgi:hypothetical protein
MKEILKRLKTALNTLDDQDFQLIQESDVFYTSAMEQITKHLEWMAGRKEEMPRLCPECGVKMTSEDRCCSLSCAVKFSGREVGRTEAECYNKRERSR